jgi:hypothetical protein
MPRPRFLFYVKSPSLTTRPFFLAVKYKQVILMRTLSGFCVAVLCAGGLFAQYRNPATPYVTGGFPNVVYPAGTPATVPGLTRFQPNVVYPGGGGPRLHVPGSPSSSRSSRSNGDGGKGGYGGGILYSYPYPAYYGGSYDPSLYGNGYVDPSGAPPPQQGSTVVYQPTGSPTAAPIIINIGAPPLPNGQPGPPGPSAQPQEQQEENADSSEPIHYLIAFKDHTIYSAIAYWVEGSTLHYFTSGNVHNQVSLSLVDRALTERLNREGGLEMNLPK